MDLHPSHICQEAAFFWACNLPATVRQGVRTGQSSSNPTGALSQTCLSNDHLLKDLRMLMASLPSILDLQRGSLLDNSV